MVGCLHVLSLTSDTPAITVACIFRRIGRTSVRNVLSRSVGSRRLMVTPSLAFSGSKLGITSIKYISWDSFVILGWIIRIKICIFAEISKNRIK